jgi:hypothetical protein
MPCARDPEVRLLGERPARDRTGLRLHRAGLRIRLRRRLFGPNLVYRTLDGGWVGQRDQSHDRIVRSGVTEQQFTDFVKSTYRVLLTRGLRGCYVYFMDAQTRDFVLSRIERRSSVPARAAEAAEAYQP